MWKKKKSNPKETQPEENAYPVRHVSIHELRQAIDSYAKQLKDGFPLSIIIQDDLTIDYKLLAPFLKAIPQEKYYMSKETYEIFTEDKKDLALEIDMVQKAVDQYMKINKELPIIEGDPYRKVSYFKLEKLHLIPHRPETTFYITDEEFLITYKKPK